MVRDGKATPVDLVDDGTYQNHWSATEGLESGEVLAVDNLAALSEGATVTTVPVTLDETGWCVTSPPPTPKQARSLPLMSPLIPRRQSKRMAGFFIHRPVLAWVLACVTMVVGGLGLQTWRSNNIPR